MRISSLDNYFNLQPGAAERSSSEDPTRATCRDFEGLLIASMMRQMRPRPSDRGLLPASTGEQVFWDQYCQAVGEEAARSAPLGIAEMLYRSLQTPREGDSSCASAA